MALHTAAFHDAGVLGLIDLDINYIEEWKTGQCVMKVHGDNDCHGDRFELCAMHMMPPTESWPYIKCAFESLPGMDKSPVADIDAVFDKCAATTAQAAALKACATNSTSEAWARASGAATAAAGQMYKAQWVRVDGEVMDDDSAGLPAWGAAVLKKICANADEKGLPLPDACK